jgi:acetyltransferase
MTGSYDLYRAALRQSGIIEVDDVEPIVDAAKLFGQGRLPKGNAVGVLSISGGSGVVFADAAVRGGLTLPPFAPQTLARLRKMIPAFGSAENPADITAALFNDTTLFTRTLDVVLEDPGLDQLVVLIASISGRNAALSAEIVAAAAAKTDKPVSVQWSGRQAKSEDAVKAFAAAGVPFVTTPVRLARAAAILSRFAEDQRRLLPRKVPSVTAAKGVTLPAGAVTLNEAESKAVLRGYGVPVAKEVFVASGSDSKARSPSRSCRGTCPTRRRPAGSSSA